MTAGCKLIGQILVEKGYINLFQLNEARRIQLNTGAVPLPPLGMILREMGCVSSAQVEEALRIQGGSSGVQ